jgi:hypothetical protein
VQRQQFDVANMESEGRQAILLELVDAWRDVATCTWGFFESAHKAETKAKVIMNNRELISSDLIKELYECNKAQQDELQQVLGMFSTIAGQGMLSQRSRR